MENINAKDFETLLNNFYACDTAREWAEGKDLATVWETCERGDWMLWLLGKMADKPGWLTHKQVVSIVCDCAETALKYVQPGEIRPAECIAVVRKWIVGEATIEDVEIARRAADAADAAELSAAADAAHAASAAAYAAAELSAAAYAHVASAAAHAAAAAAYASSTASADAAKKEALKLLADICRKNCTTEQSN